MKKDISLHAVQGFMILLAILYILFASAFLSLKYQMIMGAVLFLAAYSAEAFGMPYVPSATTVQKGQVTRLFIMTICAFLTLRYWFFRTTVTLSFSSVSEMFFSILLYIAESYGIMIYFMGMFVNASPMIRVPEKLPVEVETLYALSEKNMGALSEKDIDALPEKKMGGLPKKNIEEISEKNTEEFPEKNMGEFPEKNINALPTVDIYIPTYNEPEDVVRLTAMACTQVFYPREHLNIYILDDGGTVQKLNDTNPAKAAKAIKRADLLKGIALDLSINYVTRDENLHAKAGNLNESLMSCECRLDEDAFDMISCINEGIHQGCGELILILDCDHVPARDFLLKTVGFFIKDPDLFLLQTPHFFINPDPVEKNLETFRKGPSENEMFYAAIHPGLDFWNASFFCGSAAILRRKHLLEVGGIAGDTITEDAETALGLHAKGYNSAYLFKPLIIGLTPETFDDFIVQRSRWAQGMIQIFMLKNPLFQKGLTLFQKICYINTSFFWFFGFARFIFFISPLVLLFLGLKIYNASLIQVVAYAFPHLAGAYLLSNYLFGRYRHPFFSELYETIQSFYLLPAIVSVILKPRSPVFKVTPKAVSLEKDFLSHLALPFYIMLIISLAGYVAGGYRWMTTPGLTDSIILCIVWNTFNIILLLSCLGVVWEKRQMRKMHRYPTDEVVMLKIFDESEMVPARLFDLSVTGAGIMTDTPFMKTDSQMNLKHIVMHASDSYGNSYALPLEVKHVRHDGKRTILGTLFVADDKAHLLNVINFVYGDSSRWKFFSQNEKTTPVGYVRGFFRLLKIGIWGTFSNFRGVASLMKEIIKNRFVTKISKVVWR
ncbi:Strongly similar to cellulose synthase, catalytic subunit (UDP-forming) (modular protein) [Desulfamplus magnetovallimortis]|uniref:Strongly similar to cellulose synthase, catalytic subunit (UDP-forming) (Modular protein) n=1 Tax=Desulfamplus magnetovallimortis TaxID=1246637 RepID=A0A1W1HJ84_9BACT|nr:glycosyltransferase family 2 protein [Desulfamplus magnetovallimortis]SLM32432.1 Strongly similar to cellulose synthase, catalytic subunit (UDP-forming) (modular protein) [Desulfamplus magnetovallimortis]